MNAFVLQVLGSQISPLQMICRKINVLFSVPGLRSNLLGLNTF